MKRMITATGLAALFAVGLAAQSTTGTAGSTPQDPQTTTAGGGQGRGGPRTITGCLRAGDTEGTYMLTNVEGLGGRMGGGAAGAATTTGGAGTTTAGAAATTGGGQGRAMAGGIMLNADSSVDLKAHVGHKIEVTGTFAGGGRRGGDATGATGAAGATTTGGGTTTGTATGTTAAGAGQTAGTTGAQGGGRAMRSMTVTSVKMVSDSCS